MPCMKLCILGSRNASETVLIKTEAEKRGHECRRVSLEDIFVEIDTSSLKIQHRKTDLYSYDVYLFRAGKKFSVYYNLLADRLSKKGKTVIDEAVGNTDLYAKPSHLLLAEHAIPQIKKVVTSGIKTARDVLIEIPHPIIIKSEDTKNERIYSDDWTDSYDTARTSKSKSFSFIEALPVNTYYSVYVVGEDIIHTTLKTVAKHDKRLHLGKLINVETVECTESMSRRVHQVRNCLGFEIMRVDLALKENECIVLDVKKYPAFSTLEGNTGAIIAEHIVKYAERKYVSMQDNDTK